MKHIASLMVLGICFITITRYVENTNYCNRYDSGEIRQWIFDNRRTMQGKKGNLRAAVLARRAAYSARVRTCTSPFTDYNISTLR